MDYVFEEQLLDGWISVLGDAVFWTSMLEASPIALLSSLSSHRHYIYNLANTEAFTQSGESHKITIHFILVKRSLSHLKIGKT